jgi:hypothetical protein
MRAGIAVVAGLVVGVALSSPAAGLPAHHPAGVVTLGVAAPSQGATVNDSTEVRFTGTNLKAVTVYRFTRLVATATVSPDGTAATARFDSLIFRDGPLLLTAYGSDSGAPSPKAVASVRVRVDNRHADRHPAGYRLVHNDEFSGASLDRSKWCSRYQWEQYSGGKAPQVPDEDCIWRDSVSGLTFGERDTLGYATDADGNQVRGQEDEVYRDFNVNGLPMHTVQDGYLALHATKTRPEDPFLKYESALIRSKAEFAPTAEHPLYLTARLMQPDALGSWPAFWLAAGLGDRTTRPVWPPEIDMIDGAYNNQEQLANVMQTGVHAYGCGDPCPLGPFDYTYADPKFDTDSGKYHAATSLKGRWIEVGLEWHPDHLCYYLNGLKVACQNYKWLNVDGTPANTAAVFLNLGIGGPWAGADGVDDAKFPIEYGVDHLRVYRKG